MAEKILNEDGEAVVFEYDRLVWTEAERELSFKLQIEDPVLLSGMPAPPCDLLMRVELKGVSESDDDKLKPDRRKIEEEIPYDGVLGFAVYRFPGGCMNLVHIKAFVKHFMDLPRKRIVKGTIPILDVEGNYTEKAVPLGHRVYKGDVLEVDVTNYDVQYGHSAWIRFYAKPDDSKYNFVLLKDYVAKKDFTLEE